MSLPGIFVYLSKYIVQLYNLIFLSFRSLDKISYKIRAWFAIYIYIFLKLWSNGTLDLESHSWKKIASSSTLPPKIKSNTYKTVCYTYVKYIMAYIKTDWEKVQIYIHKQNLNIVFLVKGRCEKFVIYQARFQFFTLYLIKSQWFLCSDNKNTVNT